MDVCLRHHSLLIWSYLSYIPLFFPCVSFCLSFQHCWSVSKLRFHCWSVFCWRTNTVNAHLYKILSLFCSVCISYCLHESCQGKSYWSWPSPSQPANKSLTSREELNENVRLKKSVCERARVIGRGLFKHLAVWRTTLAPGPAWIWIHWESFNGLS